MKKVRTRTNKQEIDVEFVFNENERRLEQPQLPKDSQISCQHKFLLVISNH